MSSDIPIRPASTVVILRDTPGGPEVFLLRRNVTIAFMAGAHVFPGGRVDPADAEADAAWCDLPRHADAGGGPDVSFRVAASRELFEEAGILLARTPGGEFVATGEEAVRERFDRYREDIHTGATTLRAVVECEHLRLALDAVVPFARWVTPPIEVRRFDTWFFLARVPDGQQPFHDRHESMESEWVTPAAALGKAKAGTMHLPPPTWATLRELEGFGSADAAMAWAASRIIVARVPRVIEARGGREILLPGDLGHPADGSVSFETRFVWVRDRWVPHTFLR